MSRQRGGIQFDRSGRIAEKIRLWLVNIDVPAMAKLDYDIALDIPYAKFCERQKLGKAQWFMFFTTPEQKINAFLEVVREMEKEHE